MAPRKSNVSVVSTTNDDGTGTPAKADSREPGNSIDDLLLPKTMVQRLAKGVLPPNTQLQKDAVTAIQRAATLFVNHLAQIANTSTQTNNRKTIPPQAVLDALTELEFSQFLPRVEAELVKFEDVQKKKRTDYRNKLKDEEIKKKANGDESVEAGEGATEHARNATNGGGGDGDQDTEMALRPAVEREDHDGQRAAKRARFGSEEGGVALSNGGGGMNGHRRVSDGSNGGENDQDTFEDAAEEQDDIPEEEEDDDGRDDEADEEEENNEEEEDEEDDDEDEYPDEGRRLSSIEADNDANVAGDARMAGMDSADEMQDSD